MYAQVPDNYTPPAPITAPVMGFPVEAPQPHEHAQVPPGAPQEPSMQVGVHQVAWFFWLSHQRHMWNNSFHQMCKTPCCLLPWLPQLLQQLPAERVEQKEIPAEHMVLKSTFDSLVQRCQLAARDPVSLLMWICGFVLQKFKIDWWGGERKLNFGGIVGWPKMFLFFSKQKGNLTTQPNVWDTCMTNWESRR